MDSSAPNAAPSLDRRRSGRASLMTRLTTDKDRFATLPRGLKLNTTTGSIASVLTLLV